MKKIFYLVLICLFILSCSGRDKQISPALNMQEFSGFELGKNKFDANITGYTFQETDGTTIKPENCSSVLDTRIDTIAELEHYNYRQLVILCNAVKIYAIATDSSSSYFPEKPDINFYAALPTRVIPLFNSNRLNQPDNKTLTSYKTDTEIFSENDIKVKIINKEEEIYITLLGRGDFTNNDNEDLLIKIERQARKTSAKQASLLILSKSSKNGPIHVIGN